MAKNLYSALGLNKGASSDEIKKAYRKLARKYHPDVNPGDGAAEKRFKEASNAYDVLSDDKKRKLYDEFGDQGLREGFDADQARAYQRYQNVRGQPGAGFGGRGGQADLSDLISQMFGGGRASPGGNPFSGQRAPVKGRDLEASLSLDFVDALKGSEQSLTLRSPTGGEPRQLRVRIPPGAEDGSRIRLKGKGAPSPAGGPAGDLLITLQVRPHQSLTRDGDNLDLKVPITVGEALKGGKITVPTLDGSVTLKIPPRTQNGQRMRLKGKGVPKKGGAAGDLYVVLTVQLPNQASPELDKIADSIDALYSSDVRAGLSL